MRTNRALPDRRPVGTESLPDRRPVGTEGLGVALAASACWRTERVSGVMGGDAGGEGKGEGGEDKGGEGGKGEGEGGEVEVSMAVPGRKSR